MMILYEIMFCSQTVSAMLTSQTTNFFAIQDKAIEEHVQRLHRKLDEIEGLVSSSFIFNRLYNQNTF